jgi:hypothetical protein
MTMKKQPRLSRSAILAAAAALALATTLGGGAFGQVRQVQQGNVLDASPQVGSGGSNTPVQGYIPINPNAIIQGNVAGLAYFHGNVQSISPDVFHGTLGSASLNNFARTTAGGIPTSPASINQTFYLPSTVVSTAQGGLYSAPMGSGFDSRLIPRSSISPTVPTYQTQNIDVMGAGIPIRAFERMPGPISPGMPGGELSNSLYSLRISPLTNEQELKRAVPEKNAATQPGTSNENPDQPPSADQVRNNPDARSLALNNSFDPNRDRGTTTAGGMTNPRNIGEQNRLSDTYLALQAALDKAQADSLAGKTDTSATPPEKTSPDKTASAHNPRSARTARANLNPDTAVINGTTYQSTNPARPNYMPKAQIAEHLRALENQPTSTLRAGKKLPPLKTLAEIPSNREITPFDKLMKNAEELLKQEKYLDAADAYQTALISQPDNPLAAVGRAHAELGAGMFQSAGYDLKFVYTKKPELISVRYALEEFLPPKRLHILLTDLEALAANKDTGNNASFLYCYIAYNTSRTTELQQELDRWAARPWHDQWQAVAAKAWGQEPQ